MAHARPRSARRIRRIAALLAVLLITAVVIVSTLAQAALIPAAADLVDGVDLAAPVEVFGGAFVLLIGMGGLAELRSRATSSASSAWQQVQRLEQIMVLKADFTAMVAHEMGSPIAALRGRIELLASGRLAPPEQLRAIHALRDEADELNRLIRDLCFAARAERDDFAVALRPVAVRAILHEAAAFAETLPGEHPIVCRVEPDAIVLADPARIQQVMRNLVGNAAKFSLDGMPIELRATRVDQRMRIEVIDAGCGIEPDDLMRIFAKFGRGRGATGRGSAGLGLGLYLSRRIIAVHGADLTVQSSPGVGSIFGFSLEILS